MSRIFRSQQLQQRKVTDIDLRQKPMGPQNPHRPEGGFHGPQQVQDEEHLSQLERMERDAMRRIDKANQEAEAIQREAYQAGFDQGEKGGRKLALQKLEPTLNTLNTLIEAASSERERLIHQHERDLIKVAFAIAIEILKDTIQMEPERVTQVVQAALSKIPMHQKITLLVSPLDKELIENQLGSSGNESWPIEHLTLEADEEIGRGGCRIKTELGDIDACIETQLRLMKNTLWDDTPGT